VKANHRTIRKIWTHGHLGTAEADVHVLLSDGQSYVTTFVTPERLLSWLRQECARLPYPHSEFLADPYIVVVARIDMDLFTAVTEQMLVDGTFEGYYQQSVPIAE
jgi:hypothetical protein